MFICVCVFILMLLMKSYCFLLDAVILLLSTLVTVAVLNVLFINKFDLT